MGDRAPATLVIHHCPPHQIEKVLEILGDYGFNDEEEQTSGAALATTYMVDEISVGVCWELGPTLAELGLTFELHQDPKYEWDGDYFGNVPDLGTFTSSCDPEGNPHLAAHEIDKLIDRHRTLGALVDALEAASGKQWRARFAALRDSQKETASPAQP